MTRRTLIVIRIVWVAATLLLTVTWNENAWILLILLPALGPILREVSPAADLDERQRLLDYRASHYALIVTYLLLFVLFGRSWFALKHEPPIELWLLLLAPLLVRTAISVVQGFGARKMALMLGFVCGSIVLAFSMAERPFSPECLLGAGIIGFTALGVRWPRLGGGLLVVAAIACAVFLVPIGVRNTHGGWMQAVFLALALPTPLLLAGIGLIGPTLHAAKAPPDEFDDLRKTT
jgi:hypothetical protein